MFDPIRTSTHHHHFVDVDFKPDGSHHGDQDNQDVDQIDDKDPLCIVGDGHNDNVDNDNETSRKCLPNSLYPPIVNNPTQILSFPLINPKGSALPSENTPRTLSSR